MNALFVERLCSGAWFSTVATKLWQSEVVRNAILLAGILLTDRNFFSPNYLSARNKNVPVLAQITAEFCS
jgi:hypothetical protein